MKLDLDKINAFSDEELKELIEYDNNIKSDFSEELRIRADKVRRVHYGTDVYLRGLIEISSYCKNDCYYCGIRCSNRNADRYRLTKDEILSACENGYELGYRTFVMQGGEDPNFTDDIICDIVSTLRGRFEDCAITLSIGEKSYESYKRYYDAGANRFLLRHETADDAHYRKLHPDSMSLENRKRCLFDLKEIGYQVGSGFMVGSPYQTTDNLVSDIRFLQELEPDMIGIGPYICHKDTPFADCDNGTMERTVRMISILRLLFPYALIPSTTALGTISPVGRKLGLKAGANVVMPNLTPAEYRSSYAIYEGKAYAGKEAAENRDLLVAEVEAAGYNVVTSRGDVKKGQQS